MSLGLAKKVMGNDHWMGRKADYNDNNACIICSFSEWTDEK